jgi:protease II
MVARKTEIKKVEKVHGYNPSLYHQERVCADARDDTKVPISLVYRKDLIQKGNDNKYNMAELPVTLLVGVCCMLMEPMERVLM